MTEFEWFRVANYKKIETTQVVFDNYKIFLD